MRYSRFFSFVSKTSLALALSLTPLVGQAQPSLDILGALSAALIATPAPEVAALTVAGFGSIPNALLVELCTYFSEDERCSRTRQISKAFDKAVTQTLRLHYPLEEMIHAIPNFLREKATTRAIVNHAMAPLRAIQLIEDYQGVSRSITAIEEKFPDTPEKKILNRRLKNLAIRLYKGSESLTFIVALIDWVERNGMATDYWKLQRSVLDIQDQLAFSEMPLTYDLLAFCQLRGAGIKQEPTLEKNSFIKSLQTFKKESKLTKKMLPLIRSLKLNDYLTLKAQLWPLVNKVQHFKPKVNLSALTEEQLENFQLLKETNLLDAQEAYDCGRFFANQEYFERALSFYKHSAGLGHPPALYQVGSFFDSGRGTRASLDSALYYYHLAASQNYPTAHWNLGCIFKNRGYPKDHDLALHHFSKAAEIYQADNRPSLYQEAVTEMAWLHLWGHLTSPDLELAIRYFHQAEEGKNEEVYLCLADSYHTGRGVEKSLEIAFNYLDKTTVEGTDEQKARAERRRKRWIEEKESGQDHDH